MEYYEKELRDVFGETLVELAGQYPKMVVLDADLNTSAKTVFFKKAYPDRFIQCGIAESNMFGVASGLASEGFIPHASTFGTFACRKALDQVYMNIAYPRLNVKIPAAYVGMTATECGPSHNTAEDIAIMRALPHMRILDLGDNRELHSAMHVMMEYDGPVYYRVPKINAPVLFPEGHEFEFGKGYVLQEGSDISLLSTGMMTGIALAAAEILKKSGISVEVIHMPSIKPMDEDLLVRTAKKTGKVLTIENHRIFGGFGGAVAEILGEKCPTHVERMGILDDVIESATLEQLLRHYKLTPTDMAERAEAMIRTKEPAPA
jgi:transketolase